MLRTMLPFLAALLLLTALRPVPAQTPSPPAYHWHSLVLAHAKPGDILKLMHWNSPAPIPSPLPTQTQTPNNPLLPTGVRRVFALQSNNSLLVEATDAGYGQVKQIVKTLDVAPREVQLTTLFVAVPVARAKLYTPGVEASLLLPQFLNGRSRVDHPPVTMTPDGDSAALTCSLNPAGTARILYLHGVTFGQNLSGPTQENDWSAIPVILLTPRINANGSVALSLSHVPTIPDTAFSQSPNAPVNQTLASGSMAVWNVTGLFDTPGERLFLFVTPTIIGESDDHTPVNAAGGQSVTVTP